MWEVLITRKLNSRIRKEKGGTQRNPSMTHSKTCRTCAPNFKPSSLNHLLRRSRGDAPAAP